MRTRLGSKTSVRTESQLKVYSGLESKARTGLISTLTDTRKEFTLCPFWQSWRTDEQGIAMKVYGGVVMAVDVLMLLIRMSVTCVYSLYLLIVPPEQRDVSGDVVLITGTGHGMGREMALRFARLGAVLVCVDINSKANQETVDMIKQDNGKAHRYEEHYSGLRTTARRTLNFAAPGICPFYLPPHPAPRRATRSGPVTHAVTATHPGARVCTDYRVRKYIYELALARPLRWALWLMKVNHEKNNEGCV
ncbi:hypothetical protein EVAR_22343_1 [Eumeta japonica]|uniref:Short-chain dehydrogenase/reductase family 16C member 6 n=1 Tax=Eumeta variegata TaxID=151549 RepID=A0A4C1VLQ9_EUMVA|nr:hypothetical protein EVAR_22343_1 [Eumeta japonica]